MWHEGQDRIGLAEGLGRPIRMGSFRELGIGDLTRLRESFSDYAPYVLSGHAIMLQIAYEWVLRWLEFAPDAAAAGREVFLESLSEAERGMGDAILALFEPSPEQPGETTRFRRAFPWVGPGTKTEEEAVERYHRHRLLHDLLFRHSWAVMSRLPQPRAEEGLRKALTESSFYEFSWTQTEGMTPEQVSVVLAEHMRAHFSGPEGQGAIEIEDEPDSILLRFDPCGSGGAMRRRLVDTPGFARLAAASPLTWSRAGEVPTYCAHCAINELEGVRRRGHLVWATEFDPDASKPCGWRVFKDPARIPARYYERLGLEPR